MEMKIKWNTPPAMLGPKKVHGSAKMLYLANTCRRFMDPYVPAKNMMLAQNVRVYADDDTGYIEYNSPYAHYMYEGEVYGPSYPIVKGGVAVGFWSPPYKTPTGRSIHYNKFRHPLATSHWDRAMMTARARDVARSYEAYLLSRG